MNTIRICRCALCHGAATRPWENPDVCRELPLCDACHCKAAKARGKPYAAINDRLATASHGYLFNRKKARWTR